MLSLGTALVPAVQAKAPASQWLIVQRHETKLDTTIHVTRDAIRVEAGALGCHLLARAPDWQVHCFRPQEKIEWIGDLDHFSGAVMSNPYTLPKPTRHGPLPPVVGEILVCGLKCQRYANMQGEVQCSDQIVVDPMVVRFLNRLEGTPLVPSVPLYWCLNMKGRSLPAQAKSNWINTGMADDLRAGRIEKIRTTICKKVPYRAGDFEIPHGYKRKVDLIEVSYSRDQRSEIDEMLNNVGFEGRLDEKDRKKQRHK